MTYAVRFYGHVEKYTKDGREFSRWRGGEVLQAIIYCTYYTIVYYAMLYYNIPYYTTA